jgi:hypothetical protein
MHGDIIVTDLINSLPGNSSVNTVQHTLAVNNTVEVFSMWSASLNSRRNVFSVWSVRDIYKEDLFVR